MSNRIRHADIALELAHINHQRRLERERERLISAQAKLYREIYEWEILKGVWTVQERKFHPSPSRQQSIPGIELDAVGPTPAQRLAALGPASGIEERFSLGLASKARPKKPLASPQKLIAAPTRRAS